MNRLLRGFTLIELMIVIVVIAILASVAIPSYQEYVRKGKRADAGAALMGLAAVMERHFTASGNYCDMAGAGGETVADCGDAGTNDRGPPSTYPTQSPQDETVAAYNLTISDATETTYTLSAARTGPQTGDKCGTLTYTSTGQKGVTGQDSGVTWQDCW